MNYKEISNLTKKYLEETDENIVGVGYGYNIIGGQISDEKAIVFSVKKKLPIEEVDPDKLIPEEIEYEGTKYKTDVIESEYKPLVTFSFCYDEHYEWWSYWPGPEVPPTNRNTFNPVKGGVSVTNYTSNPNTVGTLGFLAIDNDTNSLVGVSNNHVLVDDAFNVSERSSGGVITNISGDIVVQAHPADDTPSNTIGKVKRYVPIKAGSYNQVDGALTTIDASKMSTSVSWQQEGLSLTSPPPFASTSEINNLLSTDPLLFSAGRTTGAKGELDTKLKTYAIGQSINIQYNKQGVDTTVVFTDCIVFVASGYTTPTGELCFFPIHSGDSGSALLANIGGTMKIIGLVFAGSQTLIPVDPNDPNSPQVAVTTYAIACRIDEVADQLNISAWNGSTPSFSDTSNIEEIVLSGQDSRPCVIKDGKKYYQVGLTNSTNIVTEDSTCT